MTVKDTSTEIVVNHEVYESNVQRLLSIAEECIDESTLRQLLQIKGSAVTVKMTSDDQSSSETVMPPFVAYDGFEPSGRMHIAQGIFKAVNVNKITASGGQFVFWVADWFALMNDKMGGDLNKIAKVGEYLVEVWKSAGMNYLTTETGLEAGPESDHSSGTTDHLFPNSLEPRVKFLLCSTALTHDAATYWPLVLRIARKFTTTRITKCCQIMGRLENNLTSAQILYPLMQCADVFYLKADVCQLGLDQRKVNALALEYSKKDKTKSKSGNSSQKLVVLSHHMLLGLKYGQEKMSKSDADSAIFMEDTVQDVIRKVTNAYCPFQLEPATTSSSASSVSNETDAAKNFDFTNAELKNPCLDYIEHILFNSSDDFKLYIPSDSNPDWNTLTTMAYDDVNSSSSANLYANIPYTSYDTLYQDFIHEVITPNQLKYALIYHLNVLLHPVRTHFSTNAKAKSLLEDIQRWKAEDAANKSKNVISASISASCDESIVPKCKECQGYDVIVLPYPSTAALSYGTVCSIAQIIRDITHRTSGQGSAKGVLLYVPDWSAYVTSTTMEWDAMESFYNMLLAALHGMCGISVDAISLKDDDVSSQINDMKLESSKMSCKFVYQSHLILKDPSRYWLTVMHAGRTITLHELQHPDTIDSSTNAKNDSSDNMMYAVQDSVLTNEQSSGYILAQLLHMSDMFHLCSNSMCSVGIQHSASWSLLFREWCRRKNMTAFGSSSCCSYTSQLCNLSLLEPPATTENMSHMEYYLTDNSSLAKSKMRKSYAFPASTTFCPVLQYARAFVFNDETNSELVLKRKEENGGNVVYSDYEKLVEDYSNELVHPGDLKNAMADVMVQVMTRVQTSVNNKDIKKWVAFEKKVAKMKK